MEENKTTKLVEYKPEMNKVNKVGVNPIADDSVNNDVAGIKDDLEQDTLEEMKEMLIGQVENFKKKIQEQVKTKERFMEQWDVDKQIWEMSLKGFKKVNPDFAFEEDPKYWELQTQKRKWQYEAETAQTVSRIGFFDLQIKQLNEELDKCQDKIDALTGDEKEEGEKNE